MQLARPMGASALLALLLLLGCGGVSPEPGPDARSPDVAGGEAAVRFTGQDDNDWPDMVVRYGRRIFYKMDVPPAAAEVPPGWIVDAPNPANATVEGPKSAVFNIRLSPLPGQEADGDVGRFDEEFVNSREFQDRVVPGSLRRSPTTIAGVPGTRMLYQVQPPAGCTVSINRVSLVTGGFLVTLTASVCVGEQEVFPLEWIERMQASFILRHT